MAKEKNRRYLTPHFIARMSDEAFDQILLSFLPEKLIDIYKFTGTAFTHGSRTRRRIKDRLAALEDSGKVYTTGMGFVNVTYHKKDEYQKNG